jgi:hypothetical protein
MHLLEMFAVMYEEEKTSEMFLSQCCFLHMPVNRGRTSGLNLWYKKDIRTIVLDRQFISLLENGSFYVDVLENSSCVKIALTVLLKCYCLHYGSKSK